MPFIKSILSEDIKNYSELWHLFEYPIDQLITYYHPINHIPNNVNSVHHQNNFDRVDWPRKWSSLTYWQVMYIKFSLNMINRIVFAWRLAWSWLQSREIAPMIIPLMFTCQFKFRWFCRTRLEFIRITQYSRSWVSFFALRVMAYSVWFHR